MSQDHPVYDLGEIDLDKTRPDFSPVFGVERLEGGSDRPRPSSRAPAARGARFRGDGPRVGSALAGSLSMFAPGLGQIAAGETAWGVFYAAGVGCCVATLWGADATLDRLVPTLALLGVPVQALTVALIAAVLALVVLHLSAVVHAFQAEEGSAGAVPHPIVTGLASFLVPGWGQILAGHRRRAVAFLAGLWAVGLAWLLVTPTAGRAIARLGLGLPSGLREGWGPIALLAAPVVIWTIAVYDGVTGAVVERARSF